MKIPLQQMIASGSSKHICHVCEKVYMHASGLSRHFRNDHKISERERVANLDDSRQCNYCGIG